MEHARQMDAARRRDRRQAGDRRDPRPSVEHRLPDALARPRLRALRGQSARRQAVQRAEGVQLHARARQERNLKHRSWSSTEGYPETSNASRAHFHRALERFGTPEKLERVVRVAEAARAAGVLMPRTTTSPGSRAGAQRRSSKPRDRNRRATGGGGRPPVTCSATHRMPSPSR